MAPMNATFGLTPGQTYGNTQNTAASTANTATGLGGGVIDDSVKPKTGGFSSDSGLDSAMKNLEKTIAGVDPLTQGLLAQSSRESAAAEAARAAYAKQSLAQQGLSGSAIAGAVAQEQRGADVASQIGKAKLGLGLMERADQATTKLADLGIQKENLEIQQGQLDIQKQNADLMKSEFEYKKEKDAKQEKLDADKLAKQEKVAAYEVKLKAAVKYDDKGNPYISAEDAAELAKDWPYEGTAPSYTNMIANGNKVKASDSLTLGVSVVTNMDPNSSFVKNPFNPDGTWNSTDPTVTKPWEDWYKAETGTDPYMKDDPNTPEDESKHMSQPAREAIAREIRRATITQAEKTLENDLAAIDRMNISDVEKEILRQKAQDQYNQFIFGSSYEVIKDENGNITGIKDKETGDITTATGEVAAEFTVTKENGAEFLVDSKTGEKISISPDFRPIMKDGKVVGYTDKKNNKTYNTAPQGPDTPTTYGGVPGVTKIDPDTEVATFGNSGAVGFNNVVYKKDNAGIVREVSEYPEASLVGLIGAETFGKIKEGEWLETAEGSFTKMNGKIYGFNTIGKDPNNADLPKEVLDAMGLKPSDLAGTKGYYVQGGKYYGSDGIELSKATPQMVKNLIKEGSGNFDSDSDPIKKTITSLYPGVNYPDAVKNYLSDNKGVFSDKDAAVVFANTPSIANQTATVVANSKDLYNFTPAYGTKVSVAGYNGYIVGTGFNGNARVFKIMDSGGNINYVSAVTNNDSYKWYNIDDGQYKAVGGN